MKIAAGVLSNPLLLALLMSVSGFLFLCSSRRRAGLWILAAGSALGYLASTSLVGNALLAPLEQEYPAMEPNQAAGVRDIVVLGSSYEPRDHIPVTGALDPDGLTRIVEGVRLARSIPDARLLLSGGSLPGFTAAAWGYAELAAELGIPQTALTVMDRARSTSEEAREIAAELGHAPFLLVTSAYHMPRAMRLMRRAGANPVAAPTGQALHVQRSGERFGLIPGSRGLRKTEAALHEYLGLAAMSLRID